MRVHEYEEEELRGLIAEAIDTHCPSICGDPRFEEITQGESLQAERDKRYLSTCTFVLNWLLCDVLGYTDPRVINRNNPGRHLKYVPSRSITMLTSGAMQAGIAVKYTGNNSPKRSDMIFVTNGPTYTEHVEVFLAERHLPDGTVEWDVAAAGQPSQVEGQVGRESFIYKTRVFANGTLSSSKGPRKLVQWIDVRRLVGNYDCVWPQK